MALMTEENIEGIYNYCDRWCERCTFTSRCAVYEEATDLSPDELDMNNKAFWDRIGQNFVKAQELLKKAAAEYGVDLFGTKTESDTGRTRLTDVVGESRRHPLALLSLEYSKVGRDWLKTQPGMLDRLEKLKSELTMGLESEEGAKKETRNIADSIAVIQWYLVFIHTKLARALMSKMDNVFSSQEYEPTRDDEGSAKIAIIAIDRSVNAWASLFDILPEHEDHFLKVLSTLQKIRSMALAEFPGAMTFVRPGFDA